ncbi:MAG: single-stranded DNA-binding protein [Acidobacteriia bacterium]|nr:single-stranded DNA-binding protein [Terriglobia bacterium]
MGSMNKVILIGRLGKDPEDRVTAGGTRVSNFSLATNQFRPGNGNGAAQETTEWHRIAAFGKAAELCIQYLHKGSLVCVEGSLQTRSWEKPPGERHYMTEIIAARVTFLDTKAKGLPQSDAAPAEADAF